VTAGRLERVATSALATFEQAFCDDEPYRRRILTQLGALGLVLNAIVLWNTRYLDAALAQLRREGYLVEDADVERLSPLIHDHINLLGRYHFTNPDRNGGDQLRPLRDPRTADDD